MCRHALSKTQQNMAWKEVISRCIRIFTANLYENSWEVKTHQWYVKHQLFRTVRRDLVQFIFGRRVVTYLEVVILQCMFHHVPSGSETTLTTTYFQIEVCHPCSCNLLIGIVSPKQFSTRVLQSLVLGKKLGHGPWQAVAAGIASARAQYRAANYSWKLAGWQLLRTQERQKLGVVSWVASVFQLLLSFRWT